MPKRPFVESAYGLPQQIFQSQRKIGRRLGLCQLVDPFRFQQAGETEELRGSTTKGANFL